MTDRVRDIHPDRPTGSRSVARALGCVVAAGVAMLTLTACSTSVDQHVVEQKTATQLTQQVGQAPESVTCPGDLEGEVGRTMRCQLRARDGSTIGVNLVVTSVQGSDVNWDIAVDDAPAP